MRLLIQFKFLSVLLGLFLVISTSEPAKAESGWALTQRNDSMGDLYVYIDNKGMKWNIPKQKIGFTTQAPDWKVSLFNDETKMFYETSLGDWQNKFSKMGKGQAAQLQNGGWQKGKVEKIAGLNCTKYVMTNNTQAAQAKGKRTLAAVRQAACWLANDITMSPTLSDMFSKTYGLPATKFFPVRIAYLGGDGRPHLALDTFNSRPFNVPGGFFNRPQGYKPAKSETEVFMDEDTRQFLKDLSQ
ncbi:MAG: hypothetical protein SFY67_14550 [Candidatus Melainabacteria bacterium]|nr:hypothetical protein [Candidatus Melainabacteria bacterium]